MASLRAKLGELTVPELQKELKERGLKRSGVKAKLIERLSEAIEAQGTNPADGGSYMIPTGKKGNAYQQTPNTGMMPMPQLQPTTVAVDNQQDVMQMYMSQQQLQTQQMVNPDQQLLYNQQFMTQGHSMQLPPMSQLLANPMQQSQDQMHLLQQQQQQGMLSPQQTGAVNHKQQTELNVQDIPLPQQQLPDNAQHTLPQPLDNQQHVQYHEQNVDMPQVLTQPGQLLHGEQPQHENAPNLNLSVHDIPLPQQEEPTVNPSQAQHHTEEQKQFEGVPADNESLNSSIASDNLFQAGQDIQNPVDLNRSKEEPVESIKPVVQHVEPDTATNESKEKDQQQVSNTTSNDSIQEEAVDENEKKDQHAAVNAESMQTEKGVTETERVERDNPTQSVAEDNIPKPQEDDAQDESMTFDVQASEEDKKLTEDVVEQPPVVKRQRKIKTSTPVQIKKRKVGEENKEVEKPAVRKRRWGSSTGNTSISINTDSLKDLIPAAVLEQDSMKEEDNEMESEPIAEKEEQEDENTGTVDESVNEDEASVSVETKPYTSDEPENIEQEAPDMPETAGNTTEQQETELLKSKPEVDSHFISKRVHIEQTPSIAEESAGSNRFREPREPLNPQCNIIHLENLVRPFTVRQLKELLQQNGTLVEDGFWINKIKSFCFATFSSEEEAIASREALDGIKWPSGSPKVLRADFAKLDQLHDITGGMLGEEREVKAVEETKEDRPRIQLEEREIKKPEVTKRRQEKEDSPAKLLDDLFNKTKTKPCIYWLPLTDQQVREKEKARDERRDQRLTDRQGSFNENQPPFRDQQQQRNRFDNDRRRSPPHQRFQDRNYRQRSISPPGRPTGRRDSYRRN